MVTIAPLSAQILFTLDPTSFQSAARHATLSTDTISNDSTLSIYDFTESGGGVGFLSFFVENRGEQPVKVEYIQFLAISNFPKLQAYSPTRLRALIDSPFREGDLNPRFLTSSGYGTIITKKKRGSFTLNPGEQARLRIDSAKLGKTSKRSFQLRLGLSQVIPPAEVPFDEAIPPPAEDQAIVAPPGGSATTRETFNFLVVINQKPSIVDPTTGIATVETPLLNPAIYKINPANGAGCGLVPITGVDDNPIGLAYSSVDNKIYTVTERPSQSLYTVDPTTGVATFVKKLSFPITGGSTQLLHNMLAKQAPIRDIWFYPNTDKLLILASVLPYSERIDLSERSNHTIIYETNTSSSGPVRVWADFYGKFAHTLIVDSQAEFIDYLSCARLAPNCERTSISIGTLAARDFGETSLLDQGDVTYPGALYAAEVPDSLREPDTPADVREFYLAERQQSGRAGAGTRFGKIMLTSSGQQVTSGTKALHIGSTGVLGLRGETSGHVVGLTYDHSRNSILALAPNATSVPGLPLLFSVGGISASVPDSQHPQSYQWGSSNLRFPNQNLSSITNGQTIDISFDDFISPETAAAIGLSPGSFTQSGSLDVRFAISNLYLQRREDATPVSLGGSSTDPLVREADLTVKPPQLSWSLGGSGSGTETVTLVCGHNCGGEITEGTVLNPEEITEDILLKPKHQDDWMPAIRAVHRTMWFLQFRNLRGGTSVDPNYASSITGTITFEVETFCSSETFTFSFTAGSSQVVPPAEDPRDDPGDEPVPYIPCVGTRVDPEQKIFEELPAVNRKFGIDLDVSGDKVIVPTSILTTNSQVEIHKFDGSQWNLEQKLEPESLYSSSVAIDGDVAAFLDTQNAIKGIQIYEFDGAVWVKEQFLPTDATGPMSMAEVVGSKRIAIGEPNTSRVHVFRKSGGVWALDEILTASDGGLGDRFGSSVSLGSVTANPVNQLILTVGAPNKTTGNASGRGAVYTFLSTDTGWEERSKLTSSDNPGTINRLFGASVDLDGSRLVVGQPGSSSIVDSSIYVYTTTNFGTTWNLEEQLQEGPLDLTDTSPRYSGGANIGNHVYVDGNNIVTSISGSSCSRFVLYEREETWNIVDVYVASELLSTPVSKITNGKILSGISIDDSFGNSSGAAYSFDIPTVIKDTSSSSSSTDVVTDPVLPDILSLQEIADRTTGICDTLDDPYAVWDVYAEGIFAHGGKWYYTQNKPGSSWFDRVDNAKGWTVDFNLKVDTVENVTGLSDTDNPEGLGVYVNDGTYQEVIYFLTQEIVFANANRSFSYDTTSSTDYRLIAQGNRLRLFARKKVTDCRFDELVNVNFREGASREGNGRRPAIAEDKNGNLHIAWYDDGNQMGQLLYSKYDGVSWTIPELIVSTRFGLQNPDIAIGDNDNIYIVYESMELESSNVGFVYKTNIAGQEDQWSDPQFIGVHTGESNTPTIAVDDKGDIHIAWEDHRFGYPEIFYNKWNLENLSWEAEQRVTQTSYGAYRPSLDIYRETAYIAWTRKGADDDSSIQLSTYNSTSNIWKSSYDGTGDTEVSDSFKTNPDYANTLVTVAGKVFISWQDETGGAFEIYNRIMNPDATVSTDVVKITNSSNDSLYPKMGEKQETGDVYIVWEDYRELDPNLDPYLDPYLVRQPPHVFVAFWNNSLSEWKSEARGQFDVRLDSLDNRRWNSPNISRSFSGNLHIVYESLMAIVEDEYLKTSDLFANIRDAVYDLSRVETFLILADEYVERDLLLSDRLLRKEIRFGDFSDTLSSRATFGSFGYWLENATEPFEITPISSHEFDISDFAVNEAIVNDHGDAWLATNCGAIFFFANSGNITVLENLLHEDIRSIAFDRNNVMFVATESGVSYSPDHINFTDINIIGASDILKIDFDKDNRILVGTRSAGAFVAEISGDFVATVKQQITNLPSQKVNVIKGDENGVIWTGTDRGLVRSFGNSLITFTTKNGLPSNHINDIAIRNGAIRYVATSAGLSKMVGSAFEKIGSENFDIWNNNVKSVTWQEPNIIWAGTLSRLNQIYETLENTREIAQFKPSHYSNFETTFDDPRTYFIITEDEFEANCYTEVYLNGNQITQGFDVVLKGPQNFTLPFSMVRFKTDLKANDRVDVVIREDIKTLASFTQSDKEKLKLGINEVRINDIQVSGDSIYLAIKGDKNEVRAHRVLNLAEPAADGEHGWDEAIPIAPVDLDTTPPTGLINIVNQVDATTLRVRIEDAQDDISGLDKMVISNFTNFTTDGETPQTPIPFNDAAFHKIGAFNNDANDTLTFEDEYAMGGKGASLEFFADLTHLYAGTSATGVLYRLDVKTDKWDVIVTYESDEHVDFIRQYNNVFVISVGTDAGAAKLYVYVDGTFTNPSIFPMSGKRAFAATELDNTLYVGTDDGTICAFDGTELNIIVRNVGEIIYDLTSSNGILYAATGESGRIYTVNPLQNVATIIHDDADQSIASIQSFRFNGDKVFAGTNSSGRILRTNVDDFVFDLSFRTITSKASAIKIFGDTLYASVGKILYFLSDTGTWVWRYTHTENINDIAFSSFDGTIYVISNTKITRIETLAQEKCVYLKLIDRAGNETVLFDVAGNLIPQLTDCVSIADLQDFVNENKIVEVDEYGDTVFSLFSDAPFYSGERIDEERGIYISNIFNGSNEVVKWDMVSWQATEPINTDVLIYVRSSTSKNDIILAKWQGPFTIADAAGADISFLSGQFIQFKAELTSRVKGISPSLHRVTVKLVTAEATHFFTTNFILGSKLPKGILTSQKLVPVAADIIFGLNTTNSIDWSEYQVVDENRLFDVNQAGENMRVGIRLISPTRSGLTPAEFDEYGPYGTSLFINTIDFDFLNPGSTASFNFRITIYEDINLTREIFQIFSEDNTDGFSADGEALTTDGKTVNSGSSTRIIFAVPGSAKIKCNTFYFVKIETHDGNTFDIISDTNSFTTGCTASFIDNIDFDFTNTVGSTNNFHFRIRFYEDGERTMLFKTVFSGNDTDGWFANSNQLSTSGIETSNGSSTSMLYRATLNDFEPNVIYYLTIDAFDGSNFSLDSNSFTFLARDVSSLIYCGSYFDVPVVNNFGIMFELENKQFLTLNA